MAIDSSPIGRAPHSLARRLARTLTLWVGGIWLVCVLAVGWFVSSEINRNFDQELAETAHRIFDHVLPGIAAVVPDGAVPVAAAPSIPTADPVVFQLVGRDGHMRLRSAAAPLVRFGVPLATGFSKTAGWRVFTLQHPSEPYALHVADPSRERRLARNRTLYGLLVPMGATLVLLAFLLRNVAGRELAVLRRLEEQIAERGGDDLRPLLLAGMPAELHSVGEHMNRLLARLAQALDVERALAANAAHELRTPLATVRLRLQTAADHGCSPADVQAALDAVDTLAHRTERLLQLSRAESAGTLTDRPVDLARLAGMVIDECRAGPGGQRVRQGAASAAMPTAQGDIDALAIALRNLIENALRYSDGPVDVALELPCDLVVRDQGPGVAPERLQMLLQRHVRDSSTRAGYGLGLSIVTTIMQRHGGSLLLQSPVPGSASGLEARLRLPVAGRTVLLSNK